jgi:hypothetical protein
MWSEKGRLMSTFRISISLLLRTRVSSLQHSYISHSIRHRRQRWCHSPEDYSLNISQLNPRSQ